ncbi:MAG: fibronectin type III domain-containing protein [Vicinamibacteria bacterium]
MSDRRRWFPPMFVLAAVLCCLAAPARAQTCAPAWNASQVYTAGNQASLGATNYQANWWTQGESPATHNGGPGSGQPWTGIGACSGSGGCTVIPTVPGGLASSSVTSSSVTLSWNASTAGSGCTIQYRVFQNGVQTATVTGTGLTLSGLAAGTTYTFAVGSIDQAGSSATSAPISVTTAPAGGTPIVQLYQHCNFGGWVAGFTGTGNFNTADLVSRGGIDNDSSSIRVGAGFKATLFDGNGQTGTSIVLNAGDTACFVASSFNDVLSSLRIEPATTTPAGTRFAPYVDISLATGSQVAANAAAAGVPAITLAFLVDGGCTAVWGGGLGGVSSATFPNGTSVKSAIDSLTGAGRRVIISWGGAAGSVLSSCGSAAQAQAMYQSVYNAYPNIAGQDFDIEGGVNLAVLAPALAGLKAANPTKSVSLTLPVLPTGLVPAGLDIVNAVHNAGLHPDTINIMAMDYGPANDNGGNMLLSAQQAAQAARAQTGDMIGVTPMIGVNDVATEVFTLANASAFVTWARGQAYINRLAFWSMSRDNGGCPGQPWASPTCSGVAQGPWQFSSIFNGY